MERRTVAFKRERSLPDHEIDGEGHDAPDPSRGIPTCGKLPAPRLCDDSQDVPKLTWQVNPYFLSSLNVMGTLMVVWIPSHRA